MSESVKHYFSRLKPKTRPVTESIMNNFFSWLEENSERFGSMTPDELIEYQKENKDYKLLDSIQHWIRDNDHLRSKTTQRYYSAVTSFFAHNRVPLPADPMYNTPESDTPPVSGNLELGEIIQLIEASNPMYRAVITSMVQGIMGASEFEYWNFHGLESLRTQLENEVHPIKVEFPSGRKHNPDPFYTFIGKDAINEIKRYFKTRPENDEYIFITRFKNPLTADTLRKYWNFKIKALNIVTPVKGAKHPRAVRYGKSPHEIRDTMRSRWRLSGCDAEVAEFFMGHSLDAYNYDKSPKHYEEWFREQYMKAEPWLNILSEDPQMVSREEVERLRRELEINKVGHDTQVTILQDQIDTQTQQINLIMNRFEGILDEPIDNLEFYTKGAKEQLDFFRANSSNTNISPEMIKRTEETYEYFKNKLEEKNREKEELLKLGKKNRLS